MSLVVRLVLLSGAAAAISLIIREPLARRVNARIAGALTEVAATSRLMIPRSAAMPVSPPTAASAFVPMLPPAASHTPIVPVPLTKKSAKHAPSASPAAQTITRKQVEDAIATRLDGARATLMRDEAGHPVGLRLTGVGRLAPYGVHDGDVLVSANGMALRTPDEALAALGKLQDAKRIVVVLRRGAASYAIPIDLVE